MNPPRRRRHGMGKRILLALAAGLLGGMISAAASWIIVTDFEVVPWWFARAGHEFVERSVGGGSFLFGSIGGAWLGRDRRHPFAWMLGGGLIAGATGITVAHFSPDERFHWSMVAIPAAGAFIAAVAESVSIAAHISWSVPRVVLIAIAVIFVVFLWPARQLFVPSIYAVIGFALASVAIAQEMRIRRLEECVYERKPPPGGRRRFGE
jgi:hypothetical protein